MKEAVIVSAARTPVGRCRGILAPVPAHMLGAAAVREAVSRAKIDPATIDDVIFANLMNNEINNMGRMVSLEAGLPIHVPGITLDRQCAASLNALAYGAIQIMAGFAQTIVVGGVESDSRRTWSLEKNSNRLFSCTSPICRYPYLYRRDRQPSHGYHSRKYCCTL